jgi:hypothetical protein
MRKLLSSLPVLLALTLAATTAASAQTAPFTRTVIVPANGTPTANGAALLTALANLNPAPNYANRWLIKLEPGIYNVGSTPVVMRPYVDMEGSGIIESHVQGAVDPSASGSLIGGLVQGASNSELRALTISCVSNATTTGCQALSLNQASPRLTQVRILVQGSGMGTHWGIRTVDSAPVLDDVEVLVSASSSSSYGIVYGGQSMLNITRSNIRVLNATGDNLAIVIKENLAWSPMRDSSVEASGGSLAMGISYLDAYTANPLFLDNVIVAAHAASGQSIGIGIHPGSLYSPSSTIYFQGGRILGATDGVGFGGRGFALHRAGGERAALFRPGQGDRHGRRECHRAVRGDCQRCRSLFAEYLSVGAPASVGARSGQRVAQPGPPLRLVDDLDAAMPVADQGERRGETDRAGPHHQSIDRPLQGHDETAFLG